jgi:hypothetical protein
MEKFDYFLFLKIKYSSILENLNDICNVYEEIIQNDNVNNEIILLNTHLKEINLYKSQIQNIEYLLENISNKIKNNCQHNFVDDLIDIDPDKSVYITYCTKCEKIVNP